MSKAKIFGYARNTLYPGPTLTINQATDGATTASMDFRCVKGDVGNLQIRRLLAKGVGIENLYSSVPSYYRFLTVESWDASDEAGAITTVSVKFKGVATPEPETPEDDPSSESTTYTRNSSLMEIPIQQGKEFEDLSESATESQAGATKGLNDKQIIAGGIAGDVEIIPGETVKVRDKVSHLWVGTLSAGGLTFWNKAVRDGRHSIRVPNTEWTESCSKHGKMGAALVAKFGELWAANTIPGQPTPLTIGEKDGFWYFTGITENIEGVDTAVSTNRYSRTWTYRLE